MICLERLFFNQVYTRNLELSSVLCSYCVWMEMRTGLAEAGDGAHLKVVLTVVPFSRASCELCESYRIGTARPSSIYLLISCQSLSNDDV